MVTIVIWSLPVPFLGDSGVTSEPAQRADVPHLPGHAEEHDDHQRMPAPFLFRLHHHSPPLGQQGSRRSLFPPPTAVWEPSSKVTIG